MAAAESHLVLTALGPDRPGLVNAVSSMVHGAGANLEDSRMAILGGEFALLVLVSGPEAAIVKVEAAAEPLGQNLGLSVISKRTKPESRRDFLPYALRVTGVDRPGIVASVSALIARHGINVASLESGVSFAPLSGTPLFTLEADLQVPSELALAELRRQVAALSDEENLDVTLEVKR
jgi:glycine cleavage system transcriptional repressor